MLKIIASEWFGLEGTFKDHLVKLLRRGQGHLSLDQLDRIKECDSINYISSSLDNVSNSAIITTTVHGMCILIVLIRIFFEELTKQQVILHAPNSTLRDQSEVLKANHTLGCMTQQCGQQVEGGDSAPLLWCDPTWSPASSSGALSTEKTWTCWSRARGGHKNPRAGAPLL